eukprot:5915515-Prymnesium_polylepis.1
MDTSSPSIAPPTMGASRSNRAPNQAHGTAARLVPNCASTKSIVAATLRVRTPGGSYTCHAPAPISSNDGTR